VAAEVVGVAAEVVGNDDIASLQGRCQELLD